MKSIFLSICIVVFFYSCHRNDSKINQLENEVKALEQKLNDAYKPGFGMLMSTIQQHHSKLWFAVENENWELAEFEIHEIKETFDDIKKYQKGKKETEMTAIINPFLDSIKKTIEEKDFNQFKNNYRLLTNTCNACHIANEHKYIEIKIPDFQPYANQIFKIKG